MRRRTSVSGDLSSMKDRTTRRSSSCSSVKAKFMPGKIRRRERSAASKHVCTRVLRSGDGAENRVGIRELRNQVAAVVRRAAAGERVVVTVDGRPVAQLGPLEPGAGADPR